MGCGMSKEDKEGKRRNEEIDQALRKEKAMQKSEIKLLLLGTILARDTGGRYSHMILRRWRIREIYDPQADEAHS